MISPLNRTTGPQILRLYDFCFKQGVLDACALEDDYAVRDFITEHRESWALAELGAGDDVDWKTFRFTLYKWCRRAGLTKFAENYVLLIRRLNYLWCLIPYCMRFYMMGMEEWVAYPNASRIEIFKKSPKEHWDRNGELLKFTKADYISIMHDIANEYRKIPVEERPVSVECMDSFCEAVYSLSKKYVKSV